MNRFIKMLINDPLNLFKVILFNLKNLISKLKGEKTIVYNIHQDYFYNTFESIYLKLKEEPEIKLYFAYYSQNKNLYKYLKTLIPEKMLISNQVSPFVYFDLFITAEINGPDFPLSLIPTKRIQIYHGIGAYPLYKKADVLGRFDIHLAIGPQIERFVESLQKNRKHKNRAEFIGFPKLDAIVHPDPELVSDLKNLYGIQDQTVILYAPHWNPWGSLHKFDLDMIEELSKLERVKILIKVHNFLFTRYPAENWQERLNNFAKTHPNVVFVERPNTQEIYPLGDMMITDTGTTAAFEFSLTKKPVFIFYNQEWFEEFKNSDFELEKQMTDMAVCFEKVDQVVEQIKKYMQNDHDFANIIEKQKDKQQEMIDKYLYNYGKATENAVMVIKKELKL